VVFDVDGFEIDSGAEGSGCWADDSRGGLVPAGLEFADRLFIHSKMKIYINKVA